MADLVKVCLQRLAAIVGGTHNRDVNTMRASRHPRNATILLTQILIFCSLHTILLFLRLGEDALSCDAPQTRTR
jgi:hypothetical protein